MKAKDIMQKSDKELASLIADSRSKIVTAHIDLRTKEVKNVREIRAHKRTLARALTAQNERRLTELEKKNG